MSPDSIQTQDHQEYRNRMLSSTLIACDCGKTLIIHKSLHSSRISIAINHDDASDLDTCNQAQQIVRTVNNVRSNSTPDDPNWQMNGCVYR